MIGKIVTHYKILEELGRGGMGVVYKAEDTKLKRTVVLKFLHSHLTEDKEILERFEREAQAAASLNHPNIVTIYEIDQYKELGEAKTQTFIVMEHVNGHALREEIKKSPMEVDRVVDIVLQICDGLGEAHKASIIHRDIKPENIFIDKAGRVKILDFGLAQIRGATKLTKEASTLGTAYYMSPEQYKGESVDHRADIWSLGVLLYEMITGRVPFQGEYEAAVMYSVLNDEPESIRTLRPGVPEAVDRIVQKCLEKDKNNRYESAESLSTHLIRIQTEMTKTSAAQSDSHKHRKKKSVSLFTRIIALFIAVVVAVLVSIYIIAHFNKEQEPSLLKNFHWQNSVAVLPFDDLSPERDQAYFCDGMTDDIIMKLSKVSGLRIPSRTSVMPYREISKPVREIGKELGVNTILEGSIQKEADQIRVRVKLVDVQSNSLVWSEHFDRNMSGVFALQDEISLAIVNHLKLELLGGEREKLTKQYTENTEAYNLYLRGRWFWNKWTAEDIKKAISYFREAISKDSTYALAYAGLADAYGTLSFYGPMRPEEAYPVARKLVLKALELDPELPEAYTVLAYIKAYWDWDWQGSERDFRRAIELNPNYITAHHLFSYVLVMIGRYAEALQEIQKALELDPLNLIAIRTVGDMYYHSRQYEKAIPYFLKTIEMDSTFDYAHFHLGNTYRELGRYQEALQQYQKEINLHTGTELTTLANLGVLYARMGEINKAKNIIKELNERSKREYVPPTLMSHTYFALGDMDTGFEYLYRAFSTHDHWLTQLKFYHEFDPIRNDPRYFDLMKKLKLKP
jgi:serine/threonine protein kinase/Tfp pilus assembly protein PilF